MKKFESLEEFETSLRDRKNQKIDLNRLKYSIHSSEAAALRRYKNYNKIIISAAIIFSMCFGTVAIAVYNGRQLKNEKGDIVLNYSPVSDSEFEKSLEGWDLRSDYKDIDTKLMQKLKDGEIIYYLVTDAYEIDKHYRILQKENVVRDLNALKKITTTKFKIPEYLPDSYRFEYAMITFKSELIDSIHSDIGFDEISANYLENHFAMAVNGHNETVKNRDYFRVGESLYKEAKAAGKEYIVRKSKLTKEAELITIKYINDEGYRLSLRIAEIDNIQSLTAEFDEIEKLDVSGKEVLSIRSYINESEDYVFVDESKSGNLTYYITNNGMFDVLLIDENGFSIELTKEEAIKMISSFK